MIPNKIVQFVVFETVLSVEPFIERWKNYTRSPKSDVDVILQQSEHNGSFRYIAQHRFTAVETQFVFSREKRSSRLAQESIKLNLAGGYSMLQAENPDGAGPNESKVIAFIGDPQTDLQAYKDLSVEGKLNIYEPYYQNCKHAYILEYFVKNNKADILLEQLKNLDTTDVAVYKEFKSVKNKNVPVEEEDLHVWPSF